MQLDYTLPTPQERIACVEQLIAETPQEKLTNQYLSYMSDYILFVADKGQTKKEHKENNPIITKNREVTVAKRQVSFEEIVSNLENGEDGLYALISNDKNQILDPKQKISDEDVEEVPGLKEQLDLIKSLQKQFQNATGMRRYSLKKQFIETWQQIYILRASFRGTIAKGKTSNQIKTFAHMNLEENITLDPQTLLPVSDGVITLFNPAHISFLLCYYPQLKQEGIDDLFSDMHFLLLDLEDLVEKTLKDKYPILFDLVVWKIDGLTNEEIQDRMECEYGEIHSEQYYSSLWRKRIPKMLAEQAQKDWVIWHYTNEEYGHWKYCTGCGQYKLAHPLFFAKNSSKDGYYSRCKECKAAASRKK